MSGEPRPQASDDPRPEVSDDAGPVASADPRPEVRQLQVLVGRWRTTGRTMGTTLTPSAAIEATDEYVWLPGGSLLHTVDARVGEQTVEGAEIIGYDADSGCYLTQYFGTDGPASYRARLTVEEGILTWTMESRGDRFTGRFSADRDVITGHWEQLRDVSWQPWMEVTLEKQRERPDPTGR